MIRYGRKIGLATLAALAWISWAWAQPVVAERLVAAVPELFPPQYLLDEQGRPAGYAVDTLNQLAQSMDVRIEYRVVPDWPSAMAALASGEVDLIPNVGITPERDSLFDFTAPVEAIALGVFARTTDRQIRGVADLVGKPVAVVRQNAAVNWIAEYPGIHALVFDDKETALFALLSGETDALVYPIAATWGTAAAIGVDDKIRQAGLPVKEIKRAIAVREGNRALLERLDVAVRQFTASKRYRDTYARWHTRSPVFWNPQRVLLYGGGAAGVLLFFTALIMWWWRRRLLHDLRRELQDCQNAREAAEARVERLTTQFESARARADALAMDLNAKPGSADGDFDN